MHKAQNCAKINAKSHFVFSLGLNCIPHASLDMKRTTSLFIWTETVTPSVEKRLSNLCPDSGSVSQTWWPRNRFVALQEDDAVKRARWQISFVIWAFSHTSSLTVMSQKGLVQQDAVSHSVLLSPLNIQDAYAFTSMTRVSSWWNMPSTRGSHRD